MKAKVALELRKVASTDPPKKNKNLLAQANNQPPNTANGKQSKQGKKSKKRNPFEPPPGMNS